jgi:hypothetical protein
LVVLAQGQNGPAPAWKLQRDLRYPLLAANVDQATETGFCELIAAPRFTHDESPSRDLLDTDCVEFHLLR